MAEILTKTCTFHSLCESHCTSESLSCIIQFNFICTSNLHCTSKHLCKSGSGQSGWTIIENGLLKSMIAT